LRSGATLLEVRCRKQRGIFGDGMTIEVGFKPLQCIETHPFNPKESILGQNKRVEGYRDPKKLKKFSVSVAAHLALSKATQVRALH
jgi:hypothetical protein